MIADLTNVIGLNYKKIEAEHGKKRLKPFLQSKYFNFNESANFDDMLTFAFVRHPFDRLVSAYYDKMVINKPGVLKSYRIQAIKKFR